MALAPPATWLHGGVPGLKPGDLILPPARTGVLTPRDVLGRYERDAWYAWKYDKEDPAWVFMTLDLDTAVMHAALWTVCPWTEGDGHIYRVVPEGWHERLPDDPARCGTSVCYQAVVTEVVTPCGVGRDHALSLPKMPFTAMWLRQYHEWLQRDGLLPAHGQVAVRERSEVSV
jgi:hypothetical protein